MKNLVLVAGLMLLAVSFRFFPHPMNFTPVLAMALMAGRWTKTPLGLSLPVFAMFLSDVLIGFSSISLVVYASIGLIYLMGAWMNSGSYKTIGIQAFLSSVLFFFVTNAGVWMMTTAYEPGWKGLMASYVAGIPFFHNTLLGTLVFSLGLEWVYRKSVAKLNLNPSFKAY
ncbi:MAG: hypothetical protein CL677_07140 [Bdellovibrionaceae bacterium]|nr:hypothetical protein [Pseudobdellovibrionaceae bacterium]|tara:strand:+ start:30114 stop:30623 length:510 start_codon:yes stop_codon:yes gene_type:complete